MRKGILIVEPGVVVLLHRIGDSRRQAGDHHGALLPFRSGYGIGRLHLKVSGRNLPVRIIRIALGIRGSGGNAVFKPDLSKDAG